VVFCDAPHVAAMRHRHPIIDRATRVSIEFNCPRGCFLWGGQ